MTKTKPWHALLSIPAIAAIMFGSATVARAEYPERAVHIIVPVAAGGGVDVMARMLAQNLAERLKQPFVVENRPGAAGIIGSKVVIAAAPDGYTLLYTPSSLSLSVVVHETAPYDVTKDFTPIINVAIKCWDFTNKYLVDHKAGEWFNAVSATGAISKGDKAGFWKCPYHNGRMCMEVMERVSMMEKSNHP